MTLNKDIYLTIDQDWCSDEVLNDTISLLELKKIKATIFITHDNPLIKQLRENEFIEMGIHPNFSAITGKWDEELRNILASLLKIVPEAKSVRSHGLIQSSKMLSLYKEHGLRFDSSTFIPESSNIKLSPFFDMSGLIRLPFNWADDYCFNYDVNLCKACSPKQYIEIEGLKVLDFHPINIYLNTENSKRYENARSYFNKHQMLCKLINTSAYGTKDWLIDLIDEAQKQNMQFLFISEVSIE